MHLVRRMLLRRFIAPLMRGQRPPEYIARGTSVGLMIALTPTVGVQMPVVFLLWMLARYLRPAWSFNLAIAIAWTWLTNAFTMAPVYYIFLVTGRLLLGRWDNLRGFDVFQEKFNASLSVDAGLFETLWVYTANLFEQFGLPMGVGSVPWALFAGGIGYYWSLRLVIRLRTRREQRRATRTPPLQ